MSHDRRRSIPVADSVSAESGDIRFRRMTGDGMHSAIDVNGLTKHYGDVAAVQDLSFSVRRGAVTGFLGPNGSGKTTTLKMVLGLAAPTAGAAYVMGAPYVDLEQPSRRVGALLEVTGFHPGRRGRDHLRVLAAAA